MLSTILAKLFERNYRQSGFNGFSFTTPYCRVSYSSSTGGSLYSESSSTIFLSEMVHKTCLPPQEIDLSKKTCLMLYSGR